MLENMLKIFKCSNCNNKYSIKEWDECTLGVFNNRHTRRNYKSIGDDSVRRKNSGRVYVCPGCKSNIIGENITIEI